jgi:hypothetical protein
MSETRNQFSLSRPLLVANRPELREYKAVVVVNDREVSQFSDET